MHKKKALKYFYAYLHMYPWYHPILPGEVFYIGKGYGERAWHRSQRNRRHQFIINKYGIDNLGVVIIRCESEMEAYALEEELIDTFWRHGVDLVNMTGGGKGGMRGYKHPAATCAKMKVSAKTKKPQSENALQRQRDAMRTPRMREMSRERFKNNQPSKETRLRIADKLRGIPRPEYVCEKISVALATKDLFLRNCTWCGRDFISYHAHRGVQCTDTCYSRESTYKVYTVVNKRGKPLKAVPPLDDKHNPDLLRKLGRVIIDQRYKLAA